MACASTFSWNCLTVVFWATTPAAGARVRMVILASIAIGSLDLTERILKVFAMAGERRSSRTNRWISTKSLKRRSASVTRATHHPQVPTTRAPEKLTIWEKQLAVSMGTFYQKTGHALPALAGAFSKAATRDEGAARAPKTAPVLALLITTLRAREGGAAKGARIVLPISTKTTCCADPAQVRSGHLSSRRAGEKAFVLLRIESSTG